MSRIALNQMKAKFNRHEKVFNDFWWQEMQTMKVIKCLTNSAQRGKNSHPKPNAEKDPETNTNPSV